MKKRVAILMLAVVMTVLALAGCGKKESSPVVGEWKATKMESMGMSVDLKELKEAGIDDVSIEMSIKDDGTFSMDALGESGDGTWKYSGSTLTLTVDGEDQKAEYKDGTIILDIEGSTVVFEKK